MDLLALLEVEMVQMDLLEVLHNSLTGEGSQMGSGSAPREQRAG